MACRSHPSFNRDESGEKFYQTQYPGQNVNYPTADPDHSYTGVSQQLFDDFSDQWEHVQPIMPPFGFSAKEGQATPQAPDMKGFIKSYSSRGKEPYEIMGYYGTSLMEPLSSLAKQFAVYDAWFCSMPGPTDPNRAFSLTGSSFSQVSNFETGELYTNWSDAPRRPSVWDVLWTHGIKDWKLYYHATWGDLFYTHQLFLKGHIQEVDQNPDTYLGKMGDFWSDAKAGTLPAFSFIEPAWVGNSSDIVPNSCHPPSDMESGLKLVSDIYNALRQGPDFDHTLLVITFDEHGGIYDHVPPPLANNAYRNDTDCGFAFDLLGVRVPTVLISPWIDNATVFRSTQDGREYDSTSFIATLLRWQGIPASNWWLGDRIRVAIHHPACWLLL
ncbi:hypothetical protein ID852_04810 [Xenorhabdus sp. 42]|uniref:alkaline phosphatase family protein n=1 Tax=Xenorhabdus szentirmaii TaxID=290112 RepID=UPI0019A80E1D|nr:alkaline phosphatase family protein [Xenorhabdus sp. 42]MBD2820026.1 hypothetical protein [Xenorhabdus sp. 42]